MEDNYKRKIATTHENSDEREPRSGHSRHDVSTHFNERERKSIHHKDDRSSDPKSQDRTNTHSHKSRRNRSPDRDRSRSRSPNRRNRRRKHRHRKRDDSSEDSEASKHNLKNAGNDRLKSKFELKSERLKVVSTAASASVTSSEPIQQNAGLRPASKLVEEINKRKLLFSKRPTETSAASSSTTSSLWEGTKFTDDPDGNVQAKFKRLMGIKAPESGTSEDKTASSGKAHQYLADLEKQYEVARVATHTQRGLGLGFSLSRFPQ